MYRKNCDRDMLNKMYDIIELIYILNRLTNDFYQEDYSKKYLIDTFDNMQNAKHSCSKYRKGACKNRLGCGDCGNYCKRDGILENIIFFLKSLNEG